MLADLPFQKNKQSKVQINFAELKTATALLSPTNFL